ncbi:4-hydroxybenzoate polyprenyltransferase [Marmoricola sp. OAE513]|uniref:hypothetical protein n=1 Tax=Marmoricola sp. OAE513 TaxID=2817894 RepID=UPI001AE74CA1
MADPTPSTFLQTLRVLCVALMSSLVVILVAVTFILTSEQGSDPAPPWTFAVLAAVALAATAAISQLGYRFRPIAPGTPEDEARRSSVTQMQTTTLLRFAFAESVAMVGIALAFVAEDGGIVLVLIGVAVAELLLFRHIWPSDRIITKVTEALEAEGGRSYLREALDSPAPPRG